MPTNEDAPGLESVAEMLSIPIESLHNAQTALRRGDAETALRYANFPTAFLTDLLGWNEILTPEEAGRQAGAQDAGKAIGYARGFVSKFLEKL